MYMPVFLWNLLSLLQTKLRFLILSVFIRKLWKKLTEKIRAIIGKTIINLQEFNTGYWNLKIVLPGQDRVMSYNSAYFFHTYTYTVNVISIHICVCVGWWTEHSFLALHYSAPGVHSVSYKREWMSVLWENDDNFHIT